MVSVVEYAGVELKKRGRQWWGLCPWHPDKTPSFAVDADKGLFFCYACRVGGDVITILERMNDESFIVTERRGIASMHGSRAGVLGLAQIERSNSALADLTGKTLLTATEQPSLFMHSAHVLNALISGEPLTVEKKHRDLYTFVPQAKLLWSMNELPRLSESNSGLFRRVKVQSSTSLAEDWQRLGFERYRAGGKAFYRGVRLLVTP